MVLGIDISTYLEELSSGAKFYDGEKSIDPLDAFAKNGVSCVRIRLWNNPYDERGNSYLAGSCDLDNFIALAKLVQSKGFSLMLDFHYSDFWADPGKQFIPKAWKGYNIEQLTRAVYQYTLSTLEEIKKQGIELSYIQVGNEITNGILWPLGKLTESGKTRGNYDNLCKLLSAGCNACRQASNAKIVLHLERSNDKAVYQEFFTQMAEHNIDYDIIGASYYPYWHGTFGEFFENMRSCRKFGKEIMAVEFGYGFTLEGYSQNDDRFARLVVDENSLSSFNFINEYPLTPAGQASFVRNFLRMAKENGLTGVFYWEPLWLPGENICWASPQGQDYIGESGKSTLNEWANQCLFDYKGKKLPAFDEYKK